MSEKPPEKAQRGKRSPTVTGPTAVGHAAREARRADALRRNLGRRKAQARVRADDAASPADAPGIGADGDEA